MNNTFKIRISLGRKIFLSVLVVIILMVSILYTSTTRSITEGLESEMKVRGTSISKNVSSSLSTILSSIIAERIARNPNLEKEIFSSKEIMSSIFSELQIKEEYINLIETFAEIPKTEDIMWATAVDIDNNVLAHSSPDIGFMSKFNLPKGTYNNRDILIIYNILLTNLVVSKKNFFERTISRLFGGEIKFKVSTDKLISMASEKLSIDSNYASKLINTAIRNLDSNLKNSYEKLSVLYWQIKSVQRKYDQGKFGDEFRNALSELVEIFEYEYVTYEIADKYFSKFKSFINNRKSSITKDDYNYIISLIDQFFSSSFGITGFLQYYYESYGGRSERRLLFSYPVLIKGDIDKYVANLYIGMSTESIDKTIQTVERQVQIGVLIAIIIAILLVVFLSSRISKGARIITNAMQKLSEGDLTVRALVKSRDEIGFIASNFNSMVEQIEEKEKMRDIMNKVVSEEIAKELMKKGIELGGEMRFVSMLFSDIRGFTSMSEKMDPRDLISILNEYMTEMVEIVKRYKGVVDKFVGDEIMVVYGAPVSFGEQNDALLSVVTAYEMIKRMDTLHERWKEEGKPLLMPGIGINSGNVVAGNMGSKDRLSYTVIGDAVNTAARLCGAAPGKTCIVSENTYSLVKDFFEFEEQEPIKVKGKSEPLRIYKVVSINQFGYQKVEEILSNTHHST
ncbi:MAG: adenylate/guanylate cyclase domain-containing protein [Spirochaetia bacterium]|nr:adenylate/guanylate cyclase domain-containing protein [Spirochaetota bacterium]MDW8111942.1 adenylate/guanylate cyclase domain-containing protein [Spirochaetia bacterium]